MELFGRISQVVVSQVDRTFPLSVVGCRSRGHTVVGTIVSVATLLEEL